MSDAHFYRLTDSVTADDGTVTQTFASTSHTHSPWGTDLQHGGPVAGLLTRAMERLAPRPSTRLSRVCVDLLGAVPVRPVRVSARVLRPGRRIELLDSTLEVQLPDGVWRRAAQATGWRLATQPTGDVARHADPVRSAPPSGSEPVSGFTLPPTWTPGGFVEAVEFHVVHLGAEPGDASMVWVDLRLPLVAGETTSPTVQLVTISDVANGIGARLDPRRFSFLNTDLTVQIFDAPVGPWFGVEAESSIGTDGVGMGDAVLHGPRGPIGRVTQNLLVERVNSR